MTNHEKDQTLGVFADRLREPEGDWSRTRSEDRGPEQ